jgi:DNA-directed RNA polymerase subunit M/transcription elongation factor TFIIS
MTTYEMIHGNMECPFCGKILIEHEISDTVACRNINCRFNENVDIFQIYNKQVPKAIEFDDNDLNICPVCKEHVETDDKYCKNCGQRIVLYLGEEGD